MKCILKVLQNCFVDILIHAVAPGNKFMMIQTLNINKSDQHYLDFWPEVPPLQRGNTIQMSWTDSTLFVQNGCCSILYISVAILSNLMQKFCSATHPFHSVTVDQTCLQCGKPQLAVSTLPCSVKSCCQIAYTAVTSILLAIARDILISLHSSLHK